MLCRGRIGVKVAPPPAAKAARFPDGEAVLARGEHQKPGHLEEENAKLKRLVADLTLDKTMLQDVLRRKW